MVLVLIIILYAIYSYKSECQDPYGLVSEPIFRANSNMSGGAGEPSVTDVGAKGETGVASDARNSSVLILDSEFKTGGLLNAWRCNISAPGIAHFQIYRKTPISGTYLLVGENIVQATKLGENTFKINPDKQIVFQQGDYIGLRFPNLGVVKFST